ncbi:CLUMA_CG018907, isoform A [Clunio marinus]|uniref:CLUMA_CG018907, isoform A n=1 Tax=Clunio marinus TaxID=568069 RepID=A0A1J1J240_9DIPT|nr:CLUMA_CG018907, isoform A [Clunio marinus]
MKKHLLVNYRHLQFHLLLMQLLSVTTSNFNGNNIVETIENSTQSWNKLADCSQANCLRCTINGCIKCSKFIMMDSRECVDECPKSHTQQWSTTSDLMGRVCYPANVSNSIQTVFVGIICGAVLCFVIVLVGVMMFKRKHQKMNKKSIKDQLIDDEYDRHEFIRQLDELRPHSECFLHMLNDTRKQIRKLHVAGDNTASAKFYPIVRDLAKILILLNRPVELIDGPPHDWNRLLLWAERILAQYKPQQIAQLIEFLQTPTSPSFNDVDFDDDDRFSSKHTTFKSLFYSTPTTHTRKAFASTLPATVTGLNNAKDLSKRSSISNDMKHLSLPNDGDTSEKIATGSLISLHDFDDACPSTANATLQKKPKKKSPFGESFDHVKNYLSSGSLWMVEDEFIEFKLGLRPQDEITTEL